MCYVLSIVSGKNRHIMTTVEKDSFHLIRYGLTGQDGEGQSLGDMPV